MSLVATLRQLLGRPPSRECVHVGRLLQSYLDGEVEASAATRVATHLELCRVCGLEASTYRELKEALAHERPLDPDALARLRRFADDLARSGGEPSHDRVES